MNKRENAKITLEETELQQLTSLLQKKIDPALLSSDAVNLMELISQGCRTDKTATSDDVRKVSRRWQDPIIEELIPEQAFVLDLGCGNGDLLLRLMQKKNVRGQAIEVSHSQVVECIQRGVPVFHTDIDLGLRGFPDAQFDYVILEETLQTLHHPDRVLEEMLRVGRHCIVTFPNFGYWRVRLDLALRGRMPQTEWLPYQWYNTPNIHLCCLQDFLDWTTETGVSITSGFVLSEGQIRELRYGDNLYAEEALLVVEGKH